MARPARSPRPLAYPLPAPRKPIPTQPPAPSRIDEAAWARDGAWHATHDRSAEIVFLGSLAVLLAAVTVFGLRLSAAYLAVIDLMAADAVITVATVVPWVRHRCP